MNRDGCIDVADVQLAAADYGATQAASAAALGPNSQASAGGFGMLSAAGGLRALPAAEVAAAPLTFTATSTGDQVDANIGNGACATSTGTCTLRAALAEANAHAGPGTIAFNIAGCNPCTISPATLSAVAGGRQRRHHHRRLQPAGRRAQHGRAG